MIRYIGNFIAEQNEKQLKHLLRKHFDISLFTVNYLMNISQKYQFVYIETPKVACSTIKKTLQKLEQFGNDTLAPSNVHDKISSPLLSPYNLKFWTLKKALRSSDYFRFSFVRNPYSRVLSAYLNKVAKPVDKEEKYFRNKLGRGLNDEISFIDFLNIIVQQTPDKMDIHWCPQTNLLGYPSIKYDFIGRFENFGNDFQTVLKKIVNRDNIDDLIEIDQHHSTKANEQMKAYLTEETIPLITEIYKKDFENFGYSNDIEF